MVSYLLYYIGDFVEKNLRLYNHLVTVFTQQGSRNPLVELKALNSCLNARYFDNPAMETVSPDRVRPRENLKLWAKLTAETLAYDSRFMMIDHKLKEDEAIARVFCHWNAMLRGVTTVPLHDSYDEEKRIQDILDVCEVLGDANFCKRIQDPYNNLGAKAKHAVVSSLKTRLTSGLYLLDQSHGNNRFSRHQHRENIPRRNFEGSPPHDPRRSPFHATAYSTSNVSFPNPYPHPRRNEMA